MRMRMLIVAECSWNFAAEIGETVAAVVIVAEVVVSAARIAGIGHHCELA